MMLALLLLVVLVVDGIIVFVVEWKICWGFVVFCETNKKQECSIVICVVVLSEPFEASAWCPAQDDPTNQNPASIGLCRFRRLGFVLIGHFPPLENSELRPRNRHRPTTLLCWSMRARVTCNCKTVSG